MALPSLTLRNIKGTALSFTEMDDNLQNLANVEISSDTTPSLGGNLDPSGYSITSNVANTLGSGVEGSIVRFENTDTRENLSSAISILGKGGQEITLGVLGDAALAYGFTVGENYIQAKNATPTNLNFFNYGNILFNVGQTKLSSAGVVVGSGASVFINGVDVMSMVPSTGGTTDQMLTKVDGTNYNTQWVDQPVVVNIAAYTGNVISTVNGVDIGYRLIPQETTGSSTTIPMAMSGKHYYFTSANVSTVIVPANSTTAFDIGTVVTVINAGTGNVTLSNVGTSSVKFAGTGTTTNKTIIQHGVATLIKVATDDWYVNGNGVVET